MVKQIAGRGLRPAWALPYEEERVQVARGFRRHDMHVAFEDEASTVRNLGCRGRRGRRSLARGWSAGLCALWLAACSEGGAAASNPSLAPKASALEKAVVALG